MKHARIHDPVSRHQALAANRRYVTLEEAGDLLGCHPRTVRRLIAAGRLTGYRLGGRLLRVDLAEVDAVMRPLPAAGQSA